MLRTILTPLDGSRHADAALAVSIELAWKYGARLLLLHIGLRDGNVPEDLYEAASRELEKAEEEGEDTMVQPHPYRHIRVLEYLGHMLLRDAAARAKDKGVQEVESIMDFGGAGERILHHAKHEAADLIVMGSRGFSEVEGLFLGSVSHKVFHLAPCACMTVHQSDPQESLDGIKTIVVPTDGSAYADKAIDFASDLAARYGAKLTLLHVMRSNASLTQLRACVDLETLSEDARKELDPERHALAFRFGDAVIPPAISEPALREIGRQILERGQRAAEAKNVKEVALLLVDDDPARAILELAKREKADLIAMGSRGLGEVEGLFAGSVSYKVNHSAPCSCLVIH